MTLCTMFCFTEKYDLNHPSLIKVTKLLVTLHPPPPEKIKKKPNCITFLETWLNYYILYIYKLYICFVNISAKRDKMQEQLCSNILLGLLK